MEQIEILAEIKKKWPKLRELDFAKIIATLEQSKPPPHMKVKDIYRKVWSATRKQRVLDQATLIAEQALNQPLMKEPVVMDGNDTKTSTLSELQETVDKWIQSVGGGYFNEMTNTLMLAEEVGEFSALINRSYGQQKFKKTEDASNIKDKLTDELGDVLFIVTCLANQLDISLHEAMIKNIEKKVTRDSDRYK